MEEKKYPPIVPETSSYKPMGVFGKRKAEEEERKAQAVLDAMSLNLPLDPDFKWIIRYIDDKPYLSVIKKD